MADTSLDNQRREKDLALAFLILSIAFACVVFFKTTIDNQYLLEITRLRENLTSLITKL